MIMVLKLYVYWWRQIKFLTLLALRLITVFHDIVSFLEFLNIMLSLVAKDALLRDEPEDAACYQRRSGFFFFALISHSLTHSEKAIAKAF